MDGPLETPRTLGSTQSVDIRLVATGSGRIGTSIMMQVDCQKAGITPANSEVLTRDQRKCCPNGDV